MKKVKSIVTGITGQDGSFMCEYLLEKGHEVYGVYRHKSSTNFHNLEKCMNNENFHLVDGDLTDSVSLDAEVKNVQPDYFFNFAANSFVGVSWKMPQQVVQTNTIGVINCLEAIRNYAPNCHFLNMGSSEEFGDVLYSPQDAKHPLRPRSPYGASKASARHFVKVYRESYGIYAVQPWCFNHEGTRRGEQFVTRKISQGVARIVKAISLGEKFEPIYLGNLEARRDWSDAEDVIDAVWLMANQTDEPKDYVVSSGETWTIRQFIEEAFKSVNIPIRESKGEVANGYDDINGNPVVVVSKDFYRPAEVDLLLGNSDPIRAELGWKPKTNFNQLVSKMVKNDLENE